MIQADIDMTPHTFSKFFHVDLRPDNKARPFHRGVEISRYGITGRFKARNGKWLIVKTGKRNGGTAGIFLIKHKV